MGELVDVGGHCLHIMAAGEGSPVVIFEAGGAGWSLDWYPVLVEVGKFTRACAYDRAGYGWSEPGPLPRASGQITSELHALLVNAGLEPPFVLVGASFGGHTVRLFADRYPAEAAGMILVDARHEDIDSKMPPAWQKLQQNGRNMYQVMGMASRAGLLKWLGRIMGDRAEPPALQVLPPELRPVYLEAGYQPKYFESNLAELASVAESDAQVRESRSIRNLPLVVVRHGMPDLFAQMPADQAAEAEQVWQALQTDLLTISSNNRLMVAETSGHNIPLDQPGLVVEVIQEMVDQYRKEVNQ